MRKLLICLMFIACISGCSGSIDGTVKCGDELLECVTITTIPETETVLSSATGYYKISDVSRGTYQVSASSVGYILQHSNTTIGIFPEDVTVDFELTKESEVVYELAVVSVYGGGGTDLACDGSNLWYTTGSLIRKHNMDEVLSTADTYSCTDISITWDGSNIWTGRWDKVYKHNMDITLSTSAVYDVSFDSVTFCLAWDGNNIWSCTFDTNGGDINKHNMDATLSISETYTYSSLWIYKMTWANNYLWICSGQYLYKYEINGSLTRLETYSLPGYKFNGITWDGTYFWIMDDDSNKLYKCLIQEE